jgi:hypothetical protein
MYGKALHHNMNAPIAIGERFNNVHMGFWHHTYESRVDVNRSKRQLGNSSGQPKGRSQGKRKSKHDT